MANFQSDRLKCLIIEPECILAGELADELRFAFNAEVTAIPGLKLLSQAPLKMDLVVLDCPPSLPALEALFVEIGARAKNFIITHTHDIGPGCVPAGLNAILLVKPYRLETFINAANQVLNQHSMSNPAA